MKFDDLSNRVIGCAIEVHRELGPGLLESTYEQCPAHELKMNGIDFRVQHPLPVEYKGIRLDCGYRVDMLVENRLILELKSVEEVSPIHEAQLLTYMKLAGVRTGLLINFNVTILKDGIKRFVLYPFALFASFVVRERWSRGYDFEPRRARRTRRRKHDTGGMEDWPVDQFQRYEAHRTI